MRCSKCGKELSDNSRFCEFCGTQVDEKLIKQLQKEKEDAILKVEQQKNKEEFQSFITEHKKHFLLCGVILAVLVAFCSLISFLAGRKLDKTVAAYVKAYDLQNEEKMVKLMVPAGVVSDFEKLLEDNEVNLVETVKGVFGDQPLELRVVDTQEIDETLRADLDAILAGTGLDIAYKDLKIVLLSGVSNGSPESAIKVLTYKVGRKSYILPGVLEYITSCRREQDIKTAQAIATCVMTALSNEETYAALMPTYSNVVISVEQDIDYLPAGFRDVVKSYLNNVQDLKTKSDGACGFAFKVNEMSQVLVYISSDTRMDEWQVYPEVEAAYYEGVRKEPEGAVLSSEYSYARLLSAGSPIEGYWQADRAGMYIGYSVSGGDEGLTVYLQSQDFSISGGLELIHTYEGYTYGGHTGSLVFTKENTDYPTTVISLIVADSDTITLEVQNLCGYTDKPINATYTFHRGEITRDILAQYEGIWIDGGEVYSHFGTYGDVLELTYCEKCGCIHEKEYVEHDYGCYHNNPFVALYDGRTLHYLFPNEGLWIEEVQAVVYTGHYYIVDGNKLEGNAYSHGAGGSEEYLYYREGSEEASIAEILNAYNEYIRGHSETLLGVELVDIDGNQLPECFVKCQWDPALEPRIYMLSYYNGAVVELNNNATYSDIWIKENTAEIECSYRTSAWHSEGCLYYVIEDGQLVDKGHAYCEDAQDTDGNYVTTWYVEGEEVSEKRYYDYLDSFGEYVVHYDCPYSSLLEAYDNMSR